MPSKVYIAGVGATHPSQKSQNANFDTMCLVSAATKALLDSGISFNDVSHGVRGRDSKHISDMFRTFRGEDIEIDEVKDGSELERAYQLVNDQNTQCVLAVAEAEVRVLESRRGMGLPVSLTERASPPPSRLFWHLRDFCGGTRI